MVITDDSVSQSKLCWGGPLEEVTRPWRSYYFFCHMDQIMAKVVLCWHCYYNYVNCIGAISYLTFFFASSVYFFKVKLVFLTLNCSFLLLTIF